MTKTDGSIFRGDFTLVFFASLLMFTAFYILLPTLPVFLNKELNISESQIGIVLAVYTLAALLIRPFTGYLIDRYGRKYFYIPAFLLFALIFSIYPLAAAFSIILIVRFIHGLVWGVTTTTGSTLIVDIIPAKRRGEGIGLYGLAMTIPMAIGPFAGLQLTQNGNYTFMFLFAGVLALAGFLLTLFIRYPKVPKASESSFKWNNLLESSALPTTFNLLIINISYGGLVSFVSLYSIKTGVGNTGLFFIVFAVGITIARIYMGRIFDHHGPKMLAVIGIVLLAIGHLLLGSIINPVVFIATACLIGLGSGVVFPTFQAMVNNLVTPHRRGAANSTLFSGLDLGIGLGMLLTGYLAHGIGLPRTYLIYGLLNVVALAYFIFFALPHYQKHLINSIGANRELNRI
jgi:MFS family permease